MTFTLPKAVFSGLALIALAIYSGGSSVPLNAHQEMMATTHIPMIYEEIDGVREQILGVMDDMLELDREFFEYRKKHEAGYLRLWERSHSH